MKKRKMRESSGSEDGLIGASDELEVVKMMIYISSILTMGIEVRFTILAKLTLNIRPKYCPRFES